MLVSRRCEGFAMGQGLGDAEPVALESGLRAIGLARGEQFSCISPVSRHSGSCPGLAPSPAALGIGQIVEPHRISVTGCVVTEKLDPRLVGAPLALRLGNEILNLFEA